MQYRISYSILSGPVAGLDHWIDTKCVVDYLTYVDYRDTAGDPEFRFNGVIAYLDDEGNELSDLEVHRHQIMDAYSRDAKWRAGNTEGALVFAVYANLPGYSVRFVDDELEPRYELVRDCDPKTVLAYRFERLFLKVDPERRVCSDEIDLVDGPFFEANEEFLKEVCHAA